MRRKIVADCPAKRGFLMTVEAAFALLLILFAASSLALFNFQKHDSQKFYLCSDAAILLAKTGDFSSEQDIRGKVSEISSLSGLCVSAQWNKTLASSCADATRGQAVERLSLEIPVWDGSRVSSARISCGYPE